jgi:hypothetical protein
LNAAGQPIGYVVVWQSEPSAGVGDVSSWGVFGQRYDTAGQRVGGEFAINTQRTGDQSQPSVTGLDGGGFVVVWHSQRSGGYDIKAQLYSADGTPRGGEFLINESANGTHAYPHVSALHGANAGGFVVTWHDGDTLGYDVRARVFDAAGAAVGGDLLVNTHNAVSGRNDREHNPDVTGTADGGLRGGLARRRRRRL